jgi:hypothetical protein
MPRTMTVFSSFVDISVGKPGFKTADDHPVNARVCRDISRVYLIQLG